jgi:hypothetical protein
LKNRQKKETNKKIKEPTILGGRIEEQEHEWLPYLVVTSLSDATITNTVVVENGTTMEMTTMDTTIRDRSAVELISTQVEHPVLLSKESQDFDKHKQNFYAKEIKDLSGGEWYLVAQSFYRGEKKESLPKQASGQFSWFTLPKDQDY